MKRLLFFFIALFLLCGMAYALSININPSNVKVVLKPGETKSGDMIVQNMGSTSIKIKAYTEDWIYAPDGSKTFIKPGSSVFSCSNWIKLNSEAFELAPKESRKVSYTITAPKNASGGHVSVIFFESMIDQKEGIAVAGRIGAIVYQDTEGDIKTSAEIKEMTVLTTEEGLPLNIKISVQNKGNSHVSLKPKLTIQRDGKTVSESNMRPINVLPGETGAGIATLGPLTEGSFKAQAELTYDNKTLKTQSDFTIKKFPKK